MKQYVVDAFSERPFSGNPAAVCLPERWPEDELMRRIAVENNLSETAFAVREGDGWRLRWFTPGGEIDFCGHATLGAAFVVARFAEPECKRIVFRTQAGELPVEVRPDGFEMDFPAYGLRETPVTDAMESALGVRPVEAYLDRDLLMVLDSEDAVRTLAPDQERLRALDGLLACVTARGKEYDCVSRVFVPKLRIPEDPVTGSAHCMIAPYWARRLGRDTLTAFQASERTGVLRIRCRGERVGISGAAALFSVAELHI